MNQNTNYLSNQLPAAKSQFDDDPLYDVLSKTDLNKKNLNSVKNVLWDDYANLGLNLNAYNTYDNIYNNRYNYNRLPVVPEHVSFVPPPPPLPNLQSSHSNQPVSNNLYSSQSQAQPAKSAVDDLQQSPGTSDLQVNPVLNAPTAANQPQSAYSSFLAANKLELSNFNYNNYNNLPSVSQPNQVISTNSVEQQYEQAKPKFATLLQNNEVYQDRAKLVVNNLPVANQPVSVPVPIPATAARQPVSLTPAANLQSAVAFPASFADDALNKLYQTFASAAFNSASSLNPANSAVKNPSVIYYDNFIHHQTQPSSPAASLPDLSSTSLTANLPSPVDPAINQLNSIEKPALFSQQLSSELGASSLGQANSQTNSQTNSQASGLTTLTTNAVAPNLDTKLEVTTQPQLTLKPNKATRRKPVKVKRKSQRTNQRDFGSRRSKKDELVAIEK